MKKRFYLILKTTLLLHAFLPRPAHSAEDFANDDDYYADVELRARGTKILDESTQEFELKAQIFINGTLLGETPFVEGLPTGTYLIEIKFQDLTFKKQIDVKGGERYLLTADFNVPLTNEELKAKKEKEEQERLAQQRKLEQEWQEKHQKWETEMKDLALQRKPYLTSGKIFLIGGLALLGTGLGFEIAAAKKGDDAILTEQQYNRETDKQEIRELEDKYDDLVKKQKIYNAIGISALAVGGVAVVTSIVIFIKMPGLREEPKRPFLSKLEHKPSLQLSPIVNTDFFGGEILVSF